MPNPTASNRPVHFRPGFPALVVSACLTLVLPPGPADAQTRPGGSGAGPGWELEIAGGLLAPVGSPDGTTRLPAPGPSVPTSSPIFPTRQVPTWFFGDGATLLNGVNDQFGVAARIAPLDAALGAAALDTNAGGSFGVRLRRRLGPAWSAAVSVDWLATSGGLSGDLEAAAGEARASFESAFTGLLSTGPFTNPVVTASLTTGGGAREVALTGTLERRFAPIGAFTPYVTGGAGLLTGAGEQAFLVLEGRYRFSILGEVPIDETDRLTIRRDQPRVPVFVAGGGVAHDLAGRWALRIDGRVLFARGARLLADAQPVVAGGSPAGFIESFTNPAIQFSNGAATGRASTLSGALDGFEIVETGMRPRVLVTVGLVARF